HAVTGAQAIILPCLGRTERDDGKTGPQFVTVEDSMSVVHRSQGRLAPASEHLRSEPAIIAGLAHATLGGRSQVPWLELAADYDRIRDAISHVIPGFQDFNQRARDENGFVLPNAAAALKFSTQSGRARFLLHDIPRTALAPGRLLLTTV